MVPKLSTKTGLIYTYARPPIRRRGLLLDRDRLPHRRDRLDPVRGLGAALQQQLRRARARARRHGLPRGDRRDRRAPGRRLIGCGREPEQRSRGCSQSSPSLPPAPTPRTPAVRRRRPRRPSRSAAMPTATATRCSSSRGSARSRRASPAPTGKGNSPVNTFSNAKQFAEPRGPHRRRPEHRHALLDRPPRPRQGPDRAQPSGHGQALLQLRAARPLHERDRFHRHARGRRRGQSAS